MMAVYRLAVFVILNAAAARWHRLASLCGIHGHSLERLCYPKTRLFGRALLRNDKWKTFSMTKNIAKEFYKRYNV